MERLSTGLRINSAADDAAGLAIASRMRSQVDGLEQAARNANDGISMIQVAEGAVSEISNILGRMKELAVQSASGTYSATDRTALNLEFQQLMAEVDRIAKNTQWNGMTILDGGGTFTHTGAAAESISLQVGAGSGQTMAVEFKSWVPGVAWAAEDSVTDANTAGDNDSTNAKTAYGDAILAYDAGGDDAHENTFIDITTSANATAVIAEMDTAITAAAAERATYGSYINRLEYASDNLMNVAQNTDSSRSQIEDADYAAETSELARTQIIAQASTAMLAQANQSKQSVLALLQ
jgi:flagellin